jgi:3-oxoacyl-[acyl-carrier-protein] synthase-3
MKPSDLDMVILATLSPDHELPGTACFLQAKLGVPGIPALDVRQQCTGFLYGLSIADQFIRTGTYKKILVVGAEAQSKGVDKTTRGRDISVLFGDGAGAAIVGAFDGPATKAPAAVLSTHLHADGAFAKDLWVEAPAFSARGERMTREMVEEGLHYPKMNGKSVFVNATRRMPEALNEALAANGYQLGDVDLFICHQANLRIVEMVAKQLGVPFEKFFNTIDRLGNTTAATIPIGLDEAVKAGRLKPGMLVALAAFGSGFTWGSALVRW